MTEMSEQIQAMLDREQIKDCIARLARGEDRRDADLLKDCYWPDSNFDYGVYQGSFPEYLAWVVPGADTITNTQHVLGQAVVELSGNTAKAETHVISYHRVMMEGGERDTVIGGRYLDSMEKREGKWGISKRVMLYDWYQDWGHSVDWSQGVMGYPFHGDHYTGRAQGDYSTGFIGKSAE